MAEEELQKQLGRATFLLWRKLQFCRNRKGVTFVTRETLAAEELAGRRWQKLSPKQVKAGLARLRRAGLVRNHHAVLSKSKEAYLMKRTIYGAFVIDANLGDLVSIPTNALLCLKELPQRGGKRVGSGRKPRHLADCSLDYKNNQKGPHMGFNQKGPDTLYINIGLEVECSSKEETLNGRGGALPSDSLFFEEDQVGGQLPFREQRKDGSARISGDDSKKFRDDDRLFHPAIPHYPSFDVVKPAQVPAAPKIREDMTDMEKVQFLVDAHKAVVFAKTGKRVWSARAVVDPATLKEETTKAGKAKNTKVKTRFTFLKNAAEMFQRHDISPVGWLAWSLDFWLENENDNEPPRISWLYSKTRIEKHRGFYRSNATGYSGGRVIHGRQYKRLITRYLKMRSALLNSNASIPDVVDRYFPGRDYERMVDEAKEESGNMQAELRSQIQHGDYMRENQFLW
jgi:hypothetical protein